MKSFQNRYNQRGVSSSKDEVHKIVDHMDRGIFPGLSVKLPKTYLLEMKICVMSSTRMVQVRNLSLLTCGTGKRVIRKFFTELPRTVL